MKKLTLFAAVLAVMLVVACAPQEAAENTETANAEETAEAVVTYDSLVEKYTEETLKANFVHIMAATPAEEVEEAVEEAAMVEEDEEAAEEATETVDHMAMLLEKVGMTVEEWEVLTAYASENDWANVLAEEIAAKKAELENGVELEDVEEN